MLAASGRRLPFVTTLHGTDITLVGLDRSYLPITRHGIQESDGDTSISEYLNKLTIVLLFILVDTTKSIGGLLDLQ